MAWRNTHAIDESFACAISRTRMNCVSVSMTEVRNSFLLDLDTKAPPPLRFLDDIQNAPPVSRYDLPSGSQPDLGEGVGND
jgi:hypothetical protein